MQNPPKAETEEAHLLIERYTCCPRKDLTPHSSYVTSQTSKLQYLKCQDLRSQQLVPQNFIFQYRVRSGLRGGGVGIRGGMRRRECGTYARKCRAMIDIREPCPSGAKNEQHYKRSEITFQNVSNDVLTEVGRIHTYYAVRLGFEHAA